MTVLQDVPKALDVVASGAFAFVSVGLVAPSFSMKPVGSDLLIRVKASRVVLHAGTQRPTLEKTSKSVLLKPVALHAGIHRATL